MTVTTIPPDIIILRYEYYSI